LHLPVSAKLRHAEGTRDETETAAEAFVPIHRYDSVFGSLRDRTVRTGCLTGGISTVLTGKGEASADDVGELAVPNGDDPSPSDTPFDPMEGLTGHLAGMALHASGRIEVKTVLFHPRCLADRLSRALFYAFRTSTSVWLDIAVTSGSKALSGSTEYILFVFAPPSRMG